MIYLDEDIPVEVADLLRTQGHSATTTRDEQRLGSPDPVQLLFAADSGRTFVTHNRADFARLHEAWRTWAHGWGVARSHAGIIVLGRVYRKPVGEYAALLDTLLSDLPQSLTGAFHRWHPQQGWTQTP